MRTRTAMPTETSIPYRPTSWPKMRWTSPNGMIASDVTAVRIAIIGAIRNIQPTEVSA